jgi:8-oxo-dGTP pyrophosphatase MutT (NUDIX family)
MISYAVAGIPAGLDPRERVAAGLILRRGDGRSARWLLLRSRKNREWGFPKGHLDEGESPLTAALRECAEESGIGLVAIEADPLEVHYRLQSGRGKRVIYFPAVTSIHDVTLSHEHDAYAWMPAERTRRSLPFENLRALFTAYLHRLRLG